MFKVNDYIIYGRNGVCKILDIGTPSINTADRKKQYYKLHPIFENGSIVYTPVDNDKVVMRRILSKNEAKNFMENISSVEALYFENEKVCGEKYKEIMCTYDCKELIKIIKTSYLRSEERFAEGKKNTAADNKYLRMAEEFLTGELAISLDMSREYVKEFIVQAVKPMHN